MEIRITWLVVLTFMTFAYSKLEASEIAFKDGVDHLTGGGSLSLTACDINRDGTPDIVTTGAFGSGDGFVRLFIIGRNAGLKKVVDLSVSRYPTGIACTDLNNDGWLDLVVSSRMWFVDVLLGTGRGEFLPYESYSTGRFSYAVGIATGDFDRNGREDVVTINSVGSVSVLFGRGDGSLLPFIQHPIGQPAPSL